MSIVIRRLNDWKARLIDLSRNNLLYFRVGGSTLQIEEPEAIDVFQRLYLDESSWEVDLSTAGVERLERERATDGSPEDLRRPA